MAQPPGPLPMTEKPVTPMAMEDAEHLEKYPLGEEDGAKVTFTNEEEKALLRRFDWFLLPMMCFTWALAYYDKVIMGQAVLFRMRQDLDILVPGSRYSNTSMIFYVGYIIGLPVIGLSVQRFPVGRSCAVLTFAWGLTVIMTVLCHNYTGIMVQRFFLGFIEAGIAPSFVSMIAMYYTKREQAFRASIWVASAPATNMVSPMLNYGLGAINPAHGWKNMYYFAGALTMSWSFIIWWRLPDDIPSAKFITDRQKEIALERVRRTNGGSKDHDIKWNQAWEALTDINVWGLFVLSVCAYFPNGVLTTFSSLIIKDLGFSTIENLCVQIPKGFVGVLANVVPGYFAMRYAGLRFHIYTAAVTLAFAGSVALLLAPRVPGLLGALYGLHMFGAAAGQVHGLGASNIGGYTKRTVATALTYIGYSVAQTVAPILFDTDQAPGYRKGFIATMSVTAFGMVFSQFMRFHLRQRNKRRDRAGESGSAHGLEDITDFENRDFRYSL